MSVRTALERYAARVWYRPVAPLWLRPASWLYARATAHRLQRPPDDGQGPVIVVGNLVAGGSGKTPVVAALATAIARTGRRVALIARGYGGRKHTQPVAVEASHSARDVGDEPLELARTTGLTVWVCVERAQALAAARAAGAEVVISDDGLQHAALARSFEICVVDGRRAFGNGYLLPAGPLRQLPARLASVDVVLVRQPRSIEHPELERGLGFSMEFDALQPIVEGQTPPQPPAEVDAVAGIADPERFFGALEGLGFGVRRHALGDHQPIDGRWLSSLPGPVVMTMKDRMRLLGQDCRKDGFVLPVQARLPEALIDRVLAHVREWFP